jgi:large subunit ribosomal protein L25
MSSEIVLKATRRVVIGKQVRGLRREGKLPAVVYGRGIEPLPILLDLKETTQALRGQTTSHLVKLEVDGVARTSLVRDKQYHVLKGQLMHVDFQAVAMNEKLVTNVPVRLMGIAPVIKAFEGMLMTKLNELEIEAFPADLPEYIEVDVTSLAELGDTFVVGSLDLGDKVDIRHDAEEVIVIAISAVVEELEEEEVVAEAEPEIITKGKKEEEDED